LSTITYWEGNQEFEPDKFVDEVPLKAELNREELPPCLKMLTDNGIRSGQRNVVLFNMSVFFKKSQRHRWEEALTDFNKEEGVPPLNHRELQAVIRSASNKGYQYQCNQEPLTSCCNRARCLQLQHGIGSNLFNQDGVYATLNLDRLRKIDSDPPYYTVAVNGVDIDTTYEKLFDFKEFAQLVSQKLDVIAKPVKRAMWDKVMYELLKNVKVLDAPKDASTKGMILDKINEFLALSDRARGREDLLKGIPVVEDEKVLFRISDLKRYLGNAGLDKSDAQLIYSIINREGGGHFEITIKGKVGEVWWFPVEGMNRQTEEFTRETKKVEKEF
jgi:hypothetical protein